MKTQLSGSCNIFPKPMTSAVSRLSYFRLLRSNRSLLISPQTNHSSSNSLLMTCGLPGLNTSKEARSPPSPKHTPEPGCVDFITPDNCRGSQRCPHREYILAQDSDLGM